LVREVRHGFTFESPTHRSGDASVAGSPTKTSVVRLVLDERKTVARDTHLAETGERVKRARRPDAAAHRSDGRRA
jgi:hypothetical protein